MSDFRLGDRHVDIGPIRTRLRLSVSGLAEMAGALQAESPKDLGQKLRQAGPDDWNNIFGAMAFPRPKRALNSAELIQIVPVLSDVISEALGA